MIVSSKESNGKDWQKDIRRKTIGPIEVIDIQYPSHHSYGRHYDKVSKLSIVVSGKVREQYGNQEVVASSMSFVIKPNFVKHDNQFGSAGARLISLIPKEAIFQEWLESQPVFDLMWFHGLPYSKYLIRLLHAIYREPTAIELEEELIDLFGLTTSSEPSCKGPMPDWLRLLQERLQDEFDQLIRTKEMASWIGIHPVYLARVFRKHFQCSIKEYVCRLRLEKTMAELSSHRTSLSQIAYASGFSDQSHFNRTFKSCLEVSPGQFRKLTQLRLQRFS